MKTTKFRELFGGLGFVLVLAIALALGPAVAGCGGGGGDEETEGELEEGGIGAFASAAEASFEGGQIVITFSEPVDMASIPSDISVVRTSDGASIPIHRMRLTADGLALYIYAPLAYMTEFTLSVGGGADASVAKAEGGYSATGETGPNPMSIMSADGKADAVVGDGDLGYVFTGAELSAGGDLVASEMNSWGYRETEFGAQVGYDSRFPYMPASVNLRNGGGFLFSFSTGEGSGAGAFAHWDAIGPDYANLFVPMTASLDGAYSIEDVSGDGAPEIATVEINWQLPYDGSGFSIHYSGLEFAPEVGSTDADIFLPINEAYAELRPDIGSARVASGDIDGDGLTDIAHLDVEAVESGYRQLVRVYLGANGFEQASFEMPTPDDLSSDRILGLHIGDVDGDFVDDLVIPVYEAPEGAASLPATPVLVFLGRESWSGELEAGAADADAAFLPETTADNAFGLTSALLDFNGDGIEDVIIGAPLARSINGGQIQLGAAYIFYGEEGLEVKGVSDAKVTLTGQHTPALTKAPSYAYDYDKYMGSSFVVGDFDNDGYDDVMVESEFSSYTLGETLYRRFSLFMGGDMEDVTLRHSDARATVRLHILGFWF